MSLDPNHFQKSYDLRQLQFPHPLNLSDSFLPHSIVPGDLRVRQCQSQLEALLASHNIIIMTSEPGSGKTTQVPQILLENGFRVIITQPRRVTTEAGARRVAEEMGVELGGTVGFAHGLEKCYSEDTKILFATDGYKLIQELNNGSAKRRFDAIVLDEIHEMNSNMLLLLALAREHVQNHSHEESPPKLIIMSATMNAQALSEYMGGAPILSVPGRTFEVKDEEPKDSMELDIAERVENGEDIQVFLPGKREIEVMRKNLQRLGVDADLLPFHSELPSHELAKALIKGERPRVILSTDSGQTGLTPSVVTVIDSGLMRRISLVDNAEALDVEPISRFDVIQRRGRAGRDEDGKYVYYGNTPIHELRAEPIPDLLRTSIEPLTLRTLNAGLPIESIDLLFKPSPEQIHHSYETLEDLGLIHRHGKSFTVTQLGKEVVKLPVDVRAGIMISEALRREEEFPGITRDIVDIVALFETRSLTDSRKEREWKKLIGSENQSDLLAQLAVLHAAEGCSSKWLQAHGIKEAQLERALTVRQLVRDRVDLPDETLAPDRTQPHLWSRDYRRQVLECVWRGMIDSAFKRVGAGWTNGNGVRRLPKDSLINSSVELVVGVPFSIGSGSTPEESKLKPFLFFATEIDSAWYKPNARHLHHGSELGRGIRKAAVKESRNINHDPHRSRKLGKNGRRGDRHTDGRRAR